MQLLPIFYYFNKKIVCPTVKNVQSWIYGKRETLWRSRKLIFINQIKYHQNNVIRKPRQYNVLLPIKLLIEIIFRVIELQLIFTPIIIQYIFKIYNDKVIYQEITKALIRAGATFIKLGQWASTRPDILPIDLCICLARLHAKVPSHSYEWTLKCIKEEGMMNDFEWIDKDPIGSGTVAQVHYAILRGGEHVAIKVLHPNIELAIGKDLIIMKLVANLLNAFIPEIRWLNLPEEVSYFSLIMKQQIDLNFEAYTLSRFNCNFMADPTISFPKPIRASPSVLVETFEYGIPVKEFITSKCHRINREIGIIGLKSFLKMLLWDNFVHADLHPGNILVRSRRDFLYLPKDKNICNLSHAQVIFLDTGLVTELSRNDFYNFTDLFYALVVRGDGYTAAKLMIERSPLPYRDQVIDPEGFCLQVEKLIYPIFKQSRSSTNLNLQRLSITPVLFEMFDLVRKHHVKLDGSFTNLVMSLICVEGVGRQLAPDLNLLPFLMQAGLQYIAVNVAKQLQHKMFKYE